MRTATALVLVLTGLAACVPDDAGPSAEQLQERELAAREACIAERLAQTAEEELRTLETLGVAAGPLAFQEAYTNFAGLRLAALAQHDSAVNHSLSAQDSARRDSAAASIQIRLPDAGSVEENVIRSYETKFAAIYNDPDAPCNWQAELDRDQ